METYHLTADCVLVDWDAPSGEDGKRPEVKCREGTRVKLLRTQEPAGTVYTVFVKRKGVTYSNSRLYKPHNRIVKAYRVVFYHEVVSAPLNVK